LGRRQSQLSERCVAVHLPVGAEHELTGIVDVLHLCAYTSPNGAKEGEPGPIPEHMAELVREYREKLLDEVVQTVEALMERYLEGQELGVEEVAHALLVNGRGHGKERMSRLLELQGKEHVAAKEFGPGDLGGVAKLKEVQTGDLLLDREAPVEVPPLGFPEPVMSFAITPKSKGD